MKRIFQLESGFDLTIKLEIDLDKVTPQLAADVNDFWSGSEEILSAADDDIIQAYARRAAPILLMSLMNGRNELGALSELGESEGWPPVDGLGIRILGYALPEMDAAYLDVEEVTA